jgi:Fe-S-cluster containining protein
MLNHRQKITTTEVLPLTCTREGSCCHGNQVLINPWELALLASQNKLTSNEFKNTFTEYGGIRLKFNGKENKFLKKACSLYSEEIGCSSHKNRPLACRLFPIGRQIQENKSAYFFEGAQFPCFKECPDVTNLKSLKLEEYLKSQKIKNHEYAQDAYLEVTQNLADFALTLLIDTNLTKDEQRKTIQKWSDIGRFSLEKLTQNTADEIINITTTPEININLSSPKQFIEAHNEILQLYIQKKYNISQTKKEIIITCVEAMEMSLLISAAIGANILELSVHWIETALSHIDKKN